MTIDAQDETAPSLAIVRTPSRKIIQEVAAAHGVTFDDIRGRSRLRHIMLARCEAIRKVSAEWPHLSYPVLGLLFGGRDHTTIMNHLDKSGQGRSDCACDRHRRYSRRAIRQPSAAE